jgi:predicted ribosome quality control (RQC) complex YloA/Tae2 family protein
MIRVLVAFGLFVFLFATAVAAWMGANRQLGEAWASCMTEMKLEEKLAQQRSAAEVTRLIADTVDCADARKGWLASLFYGRDALLERYAEKLRLAAAAQQQMEEEFGRYEQQREEYMNDYEAQRNLLEFRQGAHQGGRD